MKKINTVISFLLILILTSCSQAQNGRFPSSQSSETTLGAEINDENNDKKENTASLETSEINLDPSLTSQSDTDIGGDHQDVPATCNFSSFSELQDFILATSGTEEQYEKYADTVDFFPTLSYADAQTIASNICSFEMPIKEDIFADDFGATYNREKGIFDLCYNIDGIQYRFVCNYGITDPIEIPYPLVKSNVLMGPYNIDLYEVPKESLYATVFTERLYGYIISGNNRLVVKISAIGTREEKLPDALFDHFDFAKIDTTVKKAEQ